MIKNNPYTGFVEPEWSFEKLRRDLESKGQALNLKDNFRSDERIIKICKSEF